MAKSVDVFMTFYIGDYLKKTTMLSCEEHGAYVLILFSLWQAGGYLPNDREKLARICRLSPKKWDGIFANISCFFVCENNQISNNRVLEEMEAANLRRVRAQANGANGGRPRKEEPAGLPSGLPSGEPTTEPRQEPKPNPEKSSSHSPSNTNTKENKQRKTFVPPTREEVSAYMKQLANPADKTTASIIPYYRFQKSDLAKFYDYYDSQEWKDKTGKPVVLWKGKLITWINHWLERNPEPTIEGV